jgi:hypothetical protein
MLAIVRNFRECVRESFLCKGFPKWTVLFVIAFLTFGGSVFAQSVSLSPTSLTFTSQVIGTTSPSKPILLTNNSGTAQPVSIFVSGDFTESDNCGGTVGANLSCNISAFFAPTAVGKITGAITVTDGSGHLLGFVGLTGTGEAPVTAAPTTLNLGTVAIGTTSAPSKPVKITNNTKATITFTITSSSDYTVQPGTCSTLSLAAGKNCSLTVTVTPTSTGTNLGSLIITDNAPSGTPLAVGLTVIGSGSANAPFSLSKSSLKFTATNGGVSASQSVTLTNTSGSPLTLNSITPSSDFTDTPTGCLGPPIPVSGTCTISVTFAPQFVGSIDGTIAIAYTGSNSPQLIDLTGTSTAQLTATPASETFTSQAVGTTSASKAIKITNNTSTTVQLNSITVSGDFLIQSNSTCTTTLLTKKFCTLNVAFQPTVSGSIIGAITVVNSATPNPLLIALSGTGTSGASATLAPTSAHQGQSLNVAITGQNTHFSSATTVNFGTNITTGTLQVNGPTSASVPIAIAAAAATGARNVTVTTGAEVANATFTVVAGTPQITLTNPNVIGATQSSLPVSVTGAFTNWTSSTTANFGPGISVGGAAAGTFGPVSVSNATNLTATLSTSGAALGSNTVQIKTGTQTLTVANGITIQTCSTSAPTILLLSPLPNATNVPTNTSLSWQFSVPMNRTTFSVYDPNTNPTGSVAVFDTTGAAIPGTITVDASGRVATFSPSQLLNVGRQYQVILDEGSSIQDTCGNNLSFTDYFFITTFAPSTTAPVLTGNNPLNGDTNIAENVGVVLQFSEPLDPITAVNGITVANGGTVVAGTFTFSTDDSGVTFQPANPLNASTVYTVSFGSQITDVAGNALSNPGSFSFTTGTSTDTTPPSVVLVVPSSGSVGVGLNVVPRVTFSKPIDQLTVNTSTFQLFYENFNKLVPAAVTVSADRLSATLTPSSALLPNTEYNVLISGYTDIAGNSGNGSNTPFTTGTSSDLIHPTVSTISPPNGTTGVPLNAQVVAVMSDDIDPTSVSNSAITLSPVAAGTVNLASDGVTLTFVPTGSLTASKTYTVTVSGFKDTEGNTATTFTSTFTTGTMTNTSALTVNSVTPVNGATGVAVNSTVVITFSANVNPVTVNTNSITIFDQSNGSATLAGSYAVSGATVTFTPQKNLPGNATIGVGVGGNVQDLAGNFCNGSNTSFTTANTVDTTAPTVTVLPANGTSNVGLNTQVVLTFSKSINPNTIINGNTVSLFNGDSPLSANISISSDNRTVTLNSNSGQLPSGATITVEATHGVQDLSGNALADFHSQFTVAQLISNTQPSIISQRPGNGMTLIPANTVITLFASAALNASTVTGAVHVSQNGVIISGTVQVLDNGQAIEFTPSTNFAPGDLIQVFVDQTAQDTNGNAMQNYSGQFTVAGAPANTPPVVVNTNPLPNATSMPLNTVIQVAYDQALSPSTVNTTNVTLFDFNANTNVAVTVTLIGGGQVIQIAPPGPLPASDTFSVGINNVTNTSSQPASSFSFNFTTGTASDTVAPTVLSITPPNTSANIGVNAAIGVTFSKAVNPITVTGSTIQVTGASMTAVPSSISFSPDFTQVTIIPEAPLPASATITITISGVQSVSGVAVTPKTTTFTTMAGPDFNAPFVVNSSVFNQETGVPINATFSMQFNKPMDQRTASSTNNVNVTAGGCFGSGVAATLSFSADSTTVFLVPTTNLSVGTTYFLSSFSMQDLAGNVQQNFCVGFTTGSVTDTSVPTLKLFSPPSTFTGIVPTNTLVQVLFNKAISATSLGQVTLQLSGSPIPISTSLINGNTGTDTTDSGIDAGIQLTPSQPLNPSTSYTISVTGVTDVQGKPMAGTMTNAFTTGTGVDLTLPTIVSVTPANGAMSVLTTTNITVVFSKAMDAISFNPTTTLVLQDQNSVIVPATITLSTNLTTATLHPTAPLNHGITYTVSVDVFGSPTDLSGNVVNGSSTTTFTTQ